MKTSHFVFLAAAVLALLLATTSAYCSGAFARLIYLCATSLSRYALKCGRCSDVDDDMKLLMHTTHTTTFHWLEQATLDY